MSEVKYRRFMKLLEKNEHLITGNTEDSILRYYGDVLPSTVNDGFLDLFTNEELVDKMKNEKLIRIQISEEELNMFINKY